jgi:heat shock protein HtpX
MDAFRNTMKTAVLLGALGGLFVLLGSLLGGRTGAMIGLALGLLTVGASFLFSDKLALKASGARLVDESQAPELYGIVRDLAQRADLPMPRVAVSPADQPNAFATGRSPRHAVVCVTNGLLATLPRDELQGVLAHELMHVKHRDILIGSIAAAVATAISFVANMAMWGAMFGGGDDDDGPSPIVLILASLLAPLAAGLLQMAVSRSREFEADRGAAELLGTGEPLARALENIETIAHNKPMQVAPQQAYAWIHNPLAEAPQPRSRHGRQGPNLARLFSTHPDTGERIHRLRTMSFA